MGCEHCGKALKAVMVKRGRTACAACRSIARTGKARYEAEADCGGCGTERTGCIRGADFALRCGPCLRADEGRGAELALYERHYKALTARNKRADAAQDRKEAAEAEAL